jgi:uncharacterized protein (TIGR02145 family)
MNHSFRILLIPVLLTGLTLCFTSCKPKPTLAVVTTTNVTDKTQTTATSGGNVTNDGNADVTTRGVCWGTSQNPITSSGKTSDGTGTGAFTSSLTGLTPGTTYYVRAYATNSEGTSYGNEVTFSSNPVILATLTTTAVTSITQTTAVAGGNISSDGGGAITARGVCWSTATAPLATGLHTTETGTTGTFTSNLTGLTSNTKYYIRAYANNSAGTAYGDENSFTTEQLKDADGNVYTSVTIGTQTWMVENLKTTKYNDGTSIPNVSDGTAWGNLTTAAYCWYQNDISNKNPYGALYNAFAVTTSKICPSGWHVPSHSEWITLVEYAGGVLVAGGKLKESGTSHWSSPNTGATDEFGFKALPGGYRSPVSTFIFLGINGSWWTTTPYNQGYGFTVFQIGNVRAIIDYISGVGPIHGMSVRCVKD